MTHTPAKRQATETASVSNQMSDLRDKAFKIVLINIFKELKESMIKEVR